MDSKKQNKMGKMPVGKLVFTMSLPLMASLLVQSLYNIVDGIFVARLSEKALTATSLVYPLQILMVAASVGTGVGVNALISRLLGAKKHEEADKIATTGLILAFICTLIFVVLGIFFSGSFAAAFTDDPETRAYCETYLKVCMTFCIGIFLETLAQRLLQATGNTFSSMISLIVGAVTNIILDPIMIFGLLGCPAMGIKGAAVATVIGQIMGAATALLLNHFRNPELHFAIKGFRFSGKSVLEIYKVGFPTIIMQAVGSIMISVINSILMPISSTAVAFFGVYYKLQNFLMMPINGLGQAAIPIVGYNYGAKNGKRVKETLKIMVPAAAIIALAGTVIFMVFTSQLLQLFSASKEMLEMGIPALRIISITFICAAVTTVLGYSASGLGNGVINMLGTAIRQLILLVPFVYLFSLSGSVDKIWFAFWISEGAAVIYSILSVRRELEKKVTPLQNN